MTEEEAALLTKRIYRKYKDHDAVQDILVSYLENPDAKQALKYKYVEVMRQRYGRRGHKLKLEPVGADIEKAYATKVTELHREEVRIFLDALTRDERVIFMLSVMWEMNPVEIGDVMGLNPRSIDVYLTKIRKKVR